MPSWIPRKLMPEILAKIHAQDRSTQVIYITGSGGEGKTILLRQIGMELGSSDGIAPSACWSGILDLYHSDVNSNSGLEQRLVEALNSGDAFTRYEEHRREFESTRKSGMGGAELEAERAKLAEAFALGFNAVTADRRVVVALDTTERVQYELDEVQKLCGLEDASTSVKPWLLDQVKQWRNCVVLLVGRVEHEPRYLEKALAQLQFISDAEYTHYELADFVAEEIQAYFATKEAELPELAAVESPARALIARVTQGRPIRLDLMMDILQNGLGLDKLLQEVQELRPEEAWEQIDRLLIDHIMGETQDRSTAMVLQYLAIARKGLDAELLHFLSGWSLETCQQLLERITERSFIKRRPEDGRLFLHDEVYALYDKCWQKAAVDIQQRSARLVEWYDEHIRALWKTPPLDKVQMDALKTDSLLYRLRADPRKGYEWYARETELAIRSTDFGLDMRLRNELLAFLKSPSAVDQVILPAGAILRDEIEADSAAYWVKRTVMRGNNREAVRLGELLKENVRGLDKQDDPYFPYARADLDLLLAEALNYLGQSESGIPLLKSIIFNLEQGRTPEVLAVENPREYRGWRRNFILGRAHNNLGYAYRTLQAHYALALREFGAALLYFRASDLLEETANTADNMGRVHAQLYHRSAAESQIEDGLQLRRHLGRKYRIALSLNSRAIFHLTFNEPGLAKRDAEEALAIFKDFEAKRGIALASITLGRALRQLGMMWSAGLYDSAQCEGLMQDSITQLEHAIEIFENEVTEPTRQIEAYNELGCTYREYAILVRHLDPGTARGSELLSKAVHFMQMALPRAQESRNVLKYLNVCQDLADTYFLQGDLNDADELLRQTEGRIPDSYKIHEGSGMQRIAPEAREEEYWLQLGKLELLAGHLAYERGRLATRGKMPAQVLDEALKHYAFAVAYFERYSKSSPRSEAMLKEIYERLKASKIEDLRRIQDQVIPRLEVVYHLDLSTLCQFFEDTLGLAIRGR